MSEAHMTQDPALLREAKLLASLSAIGNDLSKLVASKPAYEISDDLEVSLAVGAAPRLTLLLQTNIEKYAAAVLLSSKITVYKGDSATDILVVCFLFCSSSSTDSDGVQAIVKKFRFDIPPGLENIPSDWAKIISFCQLCLTQKRSKIKKAVSVPFTICSPLDDLM